MIVTRSTKKVITKRKRKYRRSKKVQSVATTTTAHAEANQQRGRPKGSKTRHPPGSDQYSTACQKCGSTERTPYNNSRTVKTTRVVNGVRYTTVTISYTQCRSCGQHRTDRVWK